MLLRQNIRTKLRGALSFPGGVPGIDHRHPALSGANSRFSAVATHGQFLSLFDSRIGGLLNGPTTAVHPVLGYGMSFATNKRVNWSGQSVVNDTSQTLAGIFYGDVSVSHLGIMDQSTSSAGGWELRATITSGQITLIAMSGSGAVNSGINITSNVPYFVAASASPSATYFVVLDLTTGVIRTATAGGVATAVAGNGTCQTGNEVNSGVFSTMTTAAVMCSSKACSMAELLAWAKDPWGFWYQPPEQYFMWRSGTVAAVMPQYNPFPQLSPMLAQ